MGMYTEIFFRADIKNDAPIIDFLNEWVNGEGVPAATPDHALFTSDRWMWLAGNNDAYFPHSYGSYFGRREFSQGRTLALHCSLKNYGGEIEQFFDWINPYISAIPGEFIGYELYEDLDPETPPTCYFKKDN